MIFFFLNFLTIGNSSQSCQGYRDGKVFFSHHIEMSCGFGDLEELSLCNLCLSGSPEVAGMYFSFRKILRLV